MFVCMALVSYWPAPVHADPRAHAETTSAYSPATPLVPTPLAEPRGEPAKAVAEASVGAPATYPHAALPPPAPAPVATPASATKASVPEMPHSTAHHTGAAVTVGHSRVRHGSVRRAKAPPQGTTSSRATKKARRIVGEHQQAFSPVRVRAAPLLDGGPRRQDTTPRATANHCSNAQVPTSTSPADISAASALARMLIARSTSESCLAHSSERQLEALETHRLVARTPTPPAPSPRSRGAAATEHALLNASHNVAAATHATPPTPTPSRRTSRGDRATLAVTPTRHSSHIFHSVRPAAPASLPVVASPPTLHAALGADVLYHAERDAFRTPRRGDRGVCPGDGGGATQPATPWAPRKAQPHRRANRSRRAEFAESMDSLGEDTASTLSTEAPSVCSTPPALAVATPCLEHAGRQPTQRRLRLTPQAPPPQPRPTTSIATQTEGGLAFVKTPDAATTREPAKATASSHGRVDTGAPRSAQLGSAASTQARAPSNVAHAPVHGASLLPRPQQHRWTIAHGSRLRRPAHVASETTRGQPELPNVVASGMSGGSAPRSAVASLAGGSPPSTPARRQGPPRGLVLLRPWHLRQVPPRGGGTPGGASSRVPPRHARRARHARGGYEHSRAAGAGGGADSQAQQPRTTRQPSPRGDHGRDVGAGGGGGRRRSYPKEQ